MINLTDKQQKELRDLTTPLMVFIRDNYHPHIHLCIDSNRVDVFEGLLGITLNPELLKASE